MPYTNEINTKLSHSEQSGQEATPISDLDGAIAAIKSVLTLPHEWDYFSLLLWAAQSYLIECLDTVFYLGFTGGTDSGKGTAVETAIILSRDGEFLGGGTKASIAATLDESKTIGLQELSDLIEAHPAIETILRNGYNQGGKETLMVKGEDGNWERTERAIFGPKVFDFHKEPSSHVLNRTIQISMVRDPCVKLALNAERKRSILAPVKAWLKRECEKALEEWDRERVTRLWEDEGFLERVDSISKKGGREAVFVAAMLTIAKVLGWPDTAIRSIISEREGPDELSPEREVERAIEAMIELEGGPGEIPVYDLLEAINRERGRMQVKRMGQRELSAILRDLGYVRGETYYTAWKGPNRGKVVILPGGLARDARDARRSRG